MDEHSAGAIIFRKEGNSILYLVVKNFRGEWGFPKGHVERGETLKMAALREIEEETGITQVTFIDGFERTLTYSFMKNGKEIKKHSTYFLATTSQTELHCSDGEHQELKWADENTIRKILSFDNLKKLFEETKKIIKTKKTIS